MKRHHRKIISSAATGLVLACGSLKVKAQTPTSSLADCLLRGDACDSKLDATEALKFYLSAEKMDPKNAHLFVCIARQYRHLMSDAGSSDEQLRLGAIALKYADRAAALAPDDSEAQLAPAIACGRLLPLEGKKQQVEMSKRIKEEADRAIKLDPKNDLAWHVLGKWHEVLANMGAITHALGSLIYGSLPSTTNENAVACFQKAIELNPNRLMHFIELGRTFAFMGRNADARRMINKGLAMPCKEKDDPETKRKGRETLASLQ
jgi:tetratricopeptide (TPR) repeat protein